MLAKPTQTVLVQGGVGANVQSYSYSLIEPSSLMMDICFSYASAIDSFLVTS